MAFKLMDNKSIIGLILDIAGYTYGPLLGLFAFGILTKRLLKERFVPYICIGVPVLCFLLKLQTEICNIDGNMMQKMACTMNNISVINIFNGYNFGLELLLLNGILTFVGLLMISKKQESFK